MSHVLVRATGGSVCLPDPATIMIDRRDGGQLVLYPPRRVWDRTALSRDELVAWHLLIASVARAMLDTLPQLAGGCINYWDAGRSPASTDPSWAWGESPFFPSFAGRFDWSKGKSALTPVECQGIVARAAAVLRDVYGDVDAQGIASAGCASCAYPTPVADLDCGRCSDCAAGAGV
jgi:hypothetical protein